MIAAIMGATGLVGRTLLTRLIESDQYQSVIVLGRAKPDLVDHQFGIEKVVFIACQLDEISEVTLPSTVDHAFCCLGTTIKQAGSEQAFIEVDKLAVIAFAEKCKSQLNPKLKFMLVTALGANAKSAVFYNRVKGETEQALIAMSLPHLTIFQPSLLLGQRDESRFFEEIGQTFFGLISSLFIGPLTQYRAIPSDLVAEAMYNTALSNTSSNKTNWITNKMMIQKNF